LMNLEVRSHQTTEDESVLCVEYLEVECSAVSSPTWNSL
jgi:hypothetical protein